MREPSIVDMSKDVEFERKWRKIPTNNDRVDISRIDPEFKYNFIYDRRFVDRVLFEAFQDGGEDLYRLPPKELVQNEEFWRKEKETDKDAREVIKGLGSFQTYDYHRIAPAAYNLSI